MTAPVDASLLYPCLGLTPARLLLGQAEKTAAAGQLAGRSETARQKGCGAGLIEVRALPALAAPAPAAAPPKPLPASTTDLQALEGSYAPANDSYGSSEKVRIVMDTVTV